MSDMRSECCNAGVFSHDIGDGVVFSMMTAYCRRCGKVLDADAFPDWHMDPDAELSPDQEREILENQEEEMKALAEFEAGIEVR